MVSSAPPERKSVNKAHQIQPAGVKRSGNTELADEQEIIVRRILPIHHPYPLRLLSSTLSASTGERAGVRCRISGVRHGDRDSILQQFINVAIGRGKTHRRAVARQHVKGDALRGATHYPGNKVLSVQPSLKGIDN